MRFSIYYHKIIDEKTNEMYVKPLIVLKRSKEIIGWTTFHEYIKSGKGKLSHLKGEAREVRTKYVVKLLNYCFFDVYNINSLNEITVEMVSNFLNDYGMCNLPTDDEGTHRKQSTVDVAIAHIIDFLTLMLRDKRYEFKFKEEYLYRIERVWSKHKKEFVDKKVPVFEVTVREDYDDKIFRDIPTDAFAIIMNHIYLNHPRILMLAANSAFAGLRPSESCNIRREDSHLGPGIMIEKIEGRVMSITLDLRHEYNLRSDEISVGGIKKHRLQRVYDGLIDNWLECYKRYNIYNFKRKYETNYGALSNTDFGKAITYRTYLNEFRTAVKEVIPEMLVDDNPEVAYYGNLLQTHRISPHILRHWFSVHLVLNGAELNDLMYWRGDKSVESSQVYINNKSDILRKHNQIAEASFNFLMWRSKNEL